MLQALAVLYVPGSPLVAFFTRAAALISADRWSPEEAANVAWACAVLPLMFCVVLYCIVLLYYIIYVYGWSPKEAANVAWACAVCIAAYVLYCIVLYYIFVLYYIYIRMEPRGGG
jgi:hypothetical protein